MLARLCVKTQQGLLCSRTVAGFSTQSNLQLSWQPYRPTSLPSERYKVQSSSLRKLFGISSISEHGFIHQLTSPPTVPRYTCGQIAPVRAFRYQQRNSSETKPKKDERQLDDLQSILKDKSLGITAKFKLLFRQYGLVMTGVHIVTSACWVALIYFALQRGIDIIPFIEKLGLFDFLERIGLSYAEKLKSSSASIWLMTYLVYELGKPIRYPVTLAGTMYTVRYLRKIGYLKPPPPAATVRELAETQGKIIQHRYRSTKTRLRNQRRAPSNGQKHMRNGKNGVSKNKA